MRDFWLSGNLPDRLELLKKITRRARNVDPARDAAFAVFDPLHDTGGLAALGAIGALVGVHFLLAVAGLGNLCHGVLSLKQKIWPARQRLRAQVVPRWLYCTAGLGLWAGRTGRGEGR